MTWTPPDDLDVLRSHIAERLVAAVTDRDAGWRTPTFATVGVDGGPRARTVVLRAIDNDRRRLVIYTDRRSAKIREIGVIDRVALSFWDSRANQQLRITGRASVVLPGPEVSAAWDALPVASRLPYLAELAPGAHPTRPEAGWPDNAGDPLTDTDAGRAVFALLAVAWTDWDWLWLGQNGHRRAHWHWGPADDLRGDWVVP
ncbi:MAG: pyridoxamine 5'-phosphate oxidase family protein [Alphaproteobacteria bacterium]|nr:pyridoxamine 5'-phosphate oxidase family protein [Alphaproteobacteria bacterium]